jgi:phosphatidylserine/phosphatidylglycerophosphate/cardiolipin synthase-like enzyme
MNRKKELRRTFTVTIAFLMSMVLLSSCASRGPQPPCPPDRINIQDCPPADAVDDSQTTDIYQKRTWVHHSKLDFDPIAIGKEFDVSIQQAYGKILGPSPEDAIRSLAAKIWMIDNAEHTIDATYYIFSRDIVGKAVLGALCNAVKRGVDVRLMVDSLGSFDRMHKDLKALENCSADAGFLKNHDGVTTKEKARSQVIIINALSKVFVRFNRRSHDKLLVTDGSYPDKAMVMTGGRNISLDYYGLKADGTRDPDAFKDMEILLKPDQSASREKLHVGDIASGYFTLLSLYRDNKKLNPWFSYGRQRDDAQQALEELKSFPEFHKYYGEMDKYMQKDFQPVQVRLAHELGNFVSTDVVEKRLENLSNNPNSIMGIIDRVFKASVYFKKLKHFRMVSPYLFLPRYTKPNGEVIYDGLEDIEKWLAEDTDRKIEIITNSVMTSDNFLAQAMIDMDLAPRLLLSEEMVEKWRKTKQQEELQSELVNSKEWQEFINNPRIKIYQMGKLDSSLLGGENEYGKLHAKFFFAENAGFIGTSNFDYRSRIYNNEMGYFFISSELQKQLDEIFTSLKEQSYLWGTEEWLQMRNGMMDVSGIKGRSARKQRTTYTRIMRTGIMWQL